MEGCGGLMTREEREKRAYIAGLQASASANGVEKVGAGGDGGRNQNYYCSQVSRTSGVKRQKGV